MAKERIEKTLVVLTQEEVHQLLQLAQRGDRDEISDYMMKVFIKKVEAILRRRCS